LHLAIVAFILSYILYIEQYYTQKSGKKCVFVLLAPSFAVIATTLTKIVGKIAEKYLSKLKQLLKCRPFCCIITYW